MTKGREEEMEKLGKEKEKGEVHDDDLEGEGAREQEG